MNGLTIQNLLVANHFTCPVFKGCSMNDSNNIFYNLRFENDYAFIVNTLVNVDQVCHWVVFSKRGIVLYFFDSLGKKPSFYNGSIARFYQLYNGPCQIVVEDGIQYEFSAVCGVYAIVFIYFLSKNRTSVSFVKNFRNVDKRVNDHRVLTMYRRIFNEKFCNIFNFTCNPPTNNNNMFR